MSSKDLNLVVTLDGKPVPDQSLGIQAFKDACLAASKTPPPQAGEWTLTAPDGRTWLHDGGNPGLATSGSGDTLAGAIGGLAARGATLEQACAWGVLLHAQAGDRLAQRLGPVGYLAREIAKEMLTVLGRLEGEIAARES